MANPIPTNEYIISVSVLSKDQLVNVNSVLNVKHHLAVQDTQTLFDKWGNISRN